MRNRFLARVGPRSNSPMTQLRFSRPGRRDASPMDRGAVFVEALVAAAIVAMILAATLRVISDGAVSQRMMENRRMALLVAQSELAAVGADIPVETGESAGFAGNLVWRVDISP